MFNLFNLGKLTGRKLVGGLQRGRRNYSGTELPYGTRLVDHKEYQELLFYLEKQDFSKNPVNWNSVIYPGLVAPGIVLPNLRGFRANLWGADLSEADLRRAKFWRADFTRADLWGAELEGIDLEGADLTGADLCKAKLERANLMNAKYSVPQVLRANFTDKEIPENLLGDMLAYEAGNHPKPNKFKEWAGDKNVPYPYDNETRTERVIPHFTPLRDAWGKGVDRTPWEIWKGLAKVYEITI